MPNSWFIYNSGDPASHFSYSQIDTVPPPYLLCNSGCCTALYAIYAKVIIGPPNTPVITPALYVNIKKAINGSDSDTAIGGPPFIKGCS